MNSRTEHANDGTYVGGFETKPPGCELPTWQTQKGRTEAERRIALELIMAPQGLISRWVADIGPAARFLPC